MCMGNVKDHYARVGDYALDIRRHNPSSSAFVKVDTRFLQHIFQRFYYCLDARKKGFTTTCRPIIGLDGWHLKQLNLANYLQQWAWMQTIIFIPLPMKQLRLRTQILGVGLLKFFCKILDLLKSLIGPLCQNRQEVFHYLLLNIFILMTLHEQLQLIKSLLKSN